MKKILFVIHALGYGGAGKMIVYLANNISKAGYDVTIYVEEQIGAHYELETGVKVYQETRFFKNYYTRHFCQIIQLRKRVKEINPDLVISFQTNQNALSVLATRGRHIPVIVSERGDPYQYNDVVAKLKTFVINKAEGGVFQTKKAMEYYGKGLQSRARVIYNPNTVFGITRPCWDDRKDELAFVGRFDIIQKRQDIMVEAFDLISKELPNIKLSFYGSGREQELIEQMVCEKNLSGRVNFKGLVKDIPNQIKDSKLFVMTSDFEGLPNALIEAMACGLACVTTDCSPGGARELIENNVNGVIVSCGDARALASAVISLLTNPTIADKMGQKAQEIIYKLSPEMIYGQWISYIEDILSNNV